jgi:membrane-associated phospholipid phosphatase
MQTLRMKLYLDLVKQNLLFFVLFVFLVTAASGISITHTKINCFIELNTLHNHLLDVFFITVTYLGDGSVIILISAIIILLWRQYRLGVQLLLAYMVSGILVQLLKHFFTAPRPKTIISDLNYHYFISGITHSGWNSFPSGHTTSIFAIVTVLTLFFKNSGACLLLLITALLVGYSRIYLGQHFLEDVIAGSILGVTTGLFVYCITLNKEWPFRGFNLNRNESGEHSYLP